MSINFSVEALTTGTFQAECYASDEPTVVATSDNYNDNAQGIIALILAHRTECDECDHYGIHSQAVVDVDVTENMHNAGASRVVQALGLDWDEVSQYGATLDAQDVLDRLTVARALTVPVAAAADPFVEVLLGGGGARYFNCDDPSDLDARLARVEKVALEALRLGRSVEIS